MRSRGFLTKFAIVVMIAALLTAVIRGSNWSLSAQTISPSVQSDLTAEKTPALVRDFAPNGKPKFDVTINQPEGPPKTKLASADPLGRTASVACSTCHSVRPANFENRTVETLDEFHLSMQFDHGKLACYACHNPVNADALRAADGSLIEYTDVMTLCSQCHGPQATAFAHDAHGGMNGFWDLSRGPQQKNNCIDCHDAHAPKYPKMIVGFKPRDRFLESDDAHDAQH